jgi:hypothetical protein
VHVAAGVAGRDHRDVAAAVAAGGRVPRPVRVCGLGVRRKDDLGAREEKSARVPAIHHVTRAGAVVSQVCVQRANLHPPTPHMNMRGVPGACLISVRAH